MNESVWVLSEISHGSTYTTAFKTWAGLECYVKDTLRFRDIEEMVDHDPSDDCVEYSLAKVKVRP